MLRPSYVVQEVSDYQGLRWPVDEYALIQSETIDGHLIDNAGKGLLWC
jgi:hypothetical protein